MSYEGILFEKKDGVADHNSEFAGQAGMQSP